MEKELVSILIPVYNRVSIVGESIDSAIKQTYKKIEIIIVDNCSNDGTWELLQDYAVKDNRIRIFRNEENIGPVNNWKRCIDEAKGEYATILFSDDLLSDNFIEETVGNLNRNTAFVLSKIKVFGNGNNAFFDPTKEKSNFSIDEYFNSILLLNKFGFPVSPCGTLFRTCELKKSLIVDIPNPLNLDYNRFGAGNDLMLFLNTALGYSEVKIAKNTITYFRSHPDSFTISNNLNVYYDYARLYFIKQNFPVLLPKYKAGMWLERKQKPVYKYIAAKLDLIFLIRLVLSKLMKHSKWH